MCVSVGFSSSRIKISWSVHNFIVMSVIIPIVITVVVVVVADPNAVKKTGEFSKRFREHSSTSFVQKDKLRCIIKKLEYYLSWSQDYADEICCQSLQV